MSLLKKTNIFEGSSGSFLSLPPVHEPILQPGLYQYVSGFVVINKWNQVKSNGLWNWRKKSFYNNGYNIFQIIMLGYVFVKYI